MTNQISATIYGVETELGEGFPHRCRSELGVMCAAGMLCAEVLAEGVIVDGMNHDAAAAEMTRIVELATESCPGINVTLGCGSAAVRAVSRKLARDHDFI